MKKLFVILVLLAFVGFQNGFLRAQNLYLQPGGTAQQLVNELLGNSNITVSNLQVTNPGSLSHGIFVDSTGLLGISTGIFLTTGNYQFIQGPNNTSSGGESLGLPGDNELNALAGSLPTYDAYSLSFNFKAPSDTIRFQYVFGSEEYNEFVNSGFNDVFAFILKGPGLPPEGVNLAKINNQPITINTINNMANAIHYIDNEPTTSPAYQKLQYDGYTQLQLAEYYPLVPGETYHLKIVIADVSDGIFDSGVFLRSGSFGNNVKCGTLTVTSATPTPPACYDGTGSLTIAQTTGGTPPYQYSVNGGPFVMANVLGNIPVGDHTLKIKDKYGCTSTHTFTMPQSNRPPLRFRSITRYNPTCPGCLNGRILVMGLGGTAPYQYSLNGTTYQTSNQFTNLGAGYYTVFVRDANGCVYKWFTVLN